LNLTVVNEAVDPTFRFMTVDWDGQIRMDPSSPYAMQRLIGLKDRFEIAFACDTDHDRHGIVTKSAGLAAAQSLPFRRHLLPLPTPAEVAQGSGGRQDGGEQPDDRSRHREAWPEALRGAGGLQVVRGWLARRLAWLRRRRERGASFVRLDGSVWTTDKDGIVPALLAAEITARMGRDPGEIYRELTREFGEPVYDRVEAPATPEQKRFWRNSRRSRSSHRDLAGEKIQTILTTRRATALPSAG
jgi:phosphoglucomutase